MSSLKQSHRVLFVLAIICPPLSGCDPGGAFLAPGDELTDPGAPAGTVWGAAVKDSVLEPFQGRWRLDLERTNEAREESSDGQPTATYSKEIELDVDGHIITVFAFGEGEYRLYSIHEHDGEVCARAFYHEDRHDPGDMSKCHVRMRIEDGRLHFNVQYPERGIDVNDPDFRNAPDVMASDPSTCPLEGDGAYTWFDWDVEIYRRAGESE